jgi:1,4-dihydroxy-2-naphthoate octaprenyltransferase
METETKKVSLLKKWIIAMRPWALPASTMPVIFGTSLAVVFKEASLRFFPFFLALLAIVIIHSAANMLSDVFDYRRGLDRNVTPVSGALVRGWLNEKKVAAGAVVLFVVGSAIGIILVFMTGRILLVIGVIGVVIGVFYTLLKYNAFGDLAVFLDFGILGSLGAWVVQTKEFSWTPVVWAIPMAMLVSAILHANNWRDITSDTQKRVRTIASILGDRGSLAYYSFLILGPFAVVLFLVILPRFLKIGIPAMPWAFLIVFLSIPNAVHLLKRAVQRHKPKRPMDFVVLDGATSKHNLIFGILSTAAVWLHFILSWI